MVSEDDMELKFQNRICFVSIAVVLVIEKMIKLLDPETTSTGIPLVF